MLSWLAKKFKSAHEGDRLSGPSVNSAISEIEKRGMKAHFYLAGAASRYDEKLSHALDTLEAAGYIVTDSSGSLVGRLVTKNQVSDEVVKQRRASFRIVE